MIKFEFIFHGKSFFLLRDVFAYAQNDEQCWAATLHSSSQEKSGLAMRDYMSHDGRIMMDIDPTRSYFTMIVIGWHIKDVKFMVILPKGRRRLSGGVAQPCAHYHFDSRDDTSQLFYFWHSDTGTTHHCVLLFWAGNVATYVPATDYLMILDPWLKSLDHNALSTLFPSYYLFSNRKKDLEKPMVLSSD